jgi:hypothetical protein
MHILCFQKMLFQNGLSGICTHLVECTPIEGLQFNTCRPTEKIFTAFFGFVRF